MRVSFFVCLSIFSAFVALGQTSVVRVPARVLDFGQLFSTFDWSRESNTELRSKLGNSLAETVIAASNESAWPSGIATLNDRNEHQAQMAYYTVFYLTTIGADKAVLIAPAAENAALPASMKPATDIYFVISLRAIELNGTIKAKPNTIPVPDQSSTQEFSAQLNQIVQGFGNSFVNLTDEMISEDDDGMVIIYGSKAPLAGATAVYFVEDLLSASTSFHAEFQGSLDPALSLKLYQGLVRKVEGTKLSCCGLSKQDEQVEGNKHIQIFQAFDPKGKMDIDYQGMTIEVHLEQGEAFDAQGLLVSNWIPVLSVFEQ